MYQGQLLERCTVACENIAALSEEGFALMRRNGIGASDTSAILGAMDKFRTADDVMVNKLQIGYTDEEREIADKVVVRKGKDLEPLILFKAGNMLDKTIWKSTDMYRLIDFPHLTVNYDGLCEIDGDLIPVEAKFVSTYGDKYYRFADLDRGRWEYQNDLSRLENLEQAASWHGIPAYYLIQVQQQMMGTGSEYAYLAALRDKDWTVYLYKIPQYDWMQVWLSVETYQFWNKVEKARRNR